ncbi:MAG: glycosyltransferase family 4 protein [Chloroflexi bacterium]|nr:glycosyltransferase family 4 protein [Chloroflexota bacterium]MBU1751410.1 glycosyltransferase family 4 protein [Chloroflexota bacterium]
MGMAGLRVVMVISDFYPTVGGGERQAQLLAGRLAARGVEVCVITRRYPGLLSLEHVDGVPIYRLRTIGRGPLAALTYTAGALRLLARPHWRGAILHGHQASLGIAPAAITALAKRRWGHQVVIKLMGSRVHAMAGTRTWPLRRWLLRQADALVVLNEPVRAALAEVELAAIVHRLPNGVDVQAFAPVDDPARRDWRSAEGPVALFVGRLDPVKQLDVLLRAWARVLGDADAPGQSPVLVLVGDGPEREALVRLAGELGIVGSVRLIGAVEQVAGWYHGADLFVLPSQVEGLSNALLEAMSCGLPVVATAVGGTPEVVEDGVNGLLVPPGDVAALSVALGRLMGDPALARQLGHAARQTVVAGYSVEAMVERYLALYESLLSAPIA